MFRNLRYWGSVIAGLVVFQIFVGVFKHVGQQVTNTEIFSGWSAPYEKMVNSLNIYLAGDYFVLIFGATGVILWFVVDYKREQFRNDYIAWKFGRMLQKTLPDRTNLNQMNSDDRKANHYLRRCKILETNDHLKVIIPCGIQDTVLRNIQERCNKASATKWLDQHYSRYSSNIHFKEAKIEYHSMMNYIIFQQK